METSPKILFISIFEEGEGGGEGRVAYEMARWFSHSFPVVMLCPGESTGLASDPDGFRRFRVQSARQGSLSMPLLSALNVHLIFKFLDEFKPDVVHIHDPALLGVVGQFWAKLNRVPVFYTAHVLPSRVLDFGAAELLHQTMNPFTEAIAEQYLLNFYANCDVVIGLNQTAADEVRQFGYSGRMIIIPNGRNLEMFHAPALADPASPARELAFVGFLSKRKNQAFLLEVMKHLPASYHLTLYGEPLSPDHLEELQQTVAAHALNVTFAGQRSQQEIAAALQQTHIFVSASKMEVQSLVVIEALASGTPVVGLSNETIDELVDESNGACLPKDASPEEFARAVQRIGELPAPEYQALCQAARRRVQHLDWSNIMARTVESYRQVLAEKAAAQPKSPLADLPALMERIPDERLRQVLADLQERISPPLEELVELVERLVIPPDAAPEKQARAAWLTILNMTASVVGYYILKSPVAVRLRTSPRRLSPFQRQRK
ncbi:MAG TPA: glycosyltransferase [Anaerolineaceae bacterium]|nr:glycosyltransferase [Anaerolineaceae bacterium]HQH36429.1 glycosyltransferase [Anaerolineaceae bacterium]